MSHDSLRSASTLGSAPGLGAAMGAASHGSLRTIPGTGTSTPISSLTSSLEGTHLPYSHPHQPSFGCASGEPAAPILTPTAMAALRINRKLRKSSILNALNDMNADTINGSVDLSGLEKLPIPHHRCEEGAEEGELERAFDLGPKLGQGAFGTVYLVMERSTGARYACKQIRKPRKGDPKAYEQLQREVALMKAVHHRYIIQLLQVYESPRRYSMIMELCEGGDLLKFLRARGRAVLEAEAQIIISRLAGAVAYLHVHGVVHRDLKPENILLSTADPEDSFNIRISDFGLAAFTTKPLVRMENVAGTPMYMAPEIVHNLDYSGMCDVWSIGVMLWLLLAGFQREAEAPLLAMIVAGKIEYPEQFWRSVSATGRHLTEALLQFDPAKRLSSSELLLHPWIQGSTHASAGIGNSCSSSTHLAASGVVYSNNNVLDLMRQYKRELVKRRVFTIVLAAVRLARRWLQQQRAMPPQPQHALPLGSVQVRRSRMEGGSELGLHELRSAPPRPRWMGKRASLSAASTMAPIGMGPGIGSILEVGTRATTDLPRYHASTAALPHQRLAPASLSHLAPERRRGEGVPPSTLAMAGGRRKSTDRARAQSVHAVAPGPHA